MTLTCAIIDDEPLALGLIRSYVEKTPFLDLIGTYSSAVEALSALKEEAIDLLFLDIQMPELNGLEFSRLVSAETKIIFTTAFSQYAIDGYKVNAIDYLLKPISYSDFLEAAQKALAWFEERMKKVRQDLQQSTASETLNDSIFVKSDYKLIRIDFSEILYFEGLKDYVKIYTELERKPILSLTSMHLLEASLPSPRFMRIHRSFIVNMEKVKVLERGQILFGDKQLPISNSYKDQVQEYINIRTIGK
ncbi:MAG: LytTR family DNA-binding domain-containing protein [Alloprevotella sp.]|nr:LytTR family DNA-binding domain-containing protein [Bacteroidales bacterium]MDY3944284.1 LytTR family DNA-binding domain-containing protein [Alloprevotella sp.]